MLKILALPFFAYLLGSIPWGLVLTRLFTSVDVRQLGSKNIGATNVRRVAGPIWGTLTLAGDTLKGAFPVWLSPVQVKIISVGQKHIKYCQNLAQELKEKSIRVEVDDNDETVGNKIRKAVAEKYGKDFFTCGPDRSPIIVYSCRHTFATRSLGRGETMGAVAMLMGNTETVCKRNYEQFDIHRAPDDMTDQTFVTGKLGFAHNHSLLCCGPRGPRPNLSVPRRR